MRSQSSILATLLVTLIFLFITSCSFAEPKEVLFWHFWGGRDRPVVEEIVDRFNRSQADFRVRPVAIPGNNLDLKFFLSIAGGDPPDLLNQDDPIVADWAERGALQRLDEIAPNDEVAKLDDWLFPAAKKLGKYRGRYYALANGLDIRALYYNKSWLEELGIQPPHTIAELDQLAETVAPAGTDPLTQVGFLPNPRRLQAWGAVFGGRFSDPDATSVEDTITADSIENLTALRWMASYSQRYGPARVAAFRTGDQAISGAAFPLLAGRRYATLMDGQWRVRDIAEATADAKRRGVPIDQYGVVTLPSPPNGKQRAGWVNGNFFVVPRGAKEPAGAWAFMKFWSGFGGYEAEAARTAAAGGWIPASQQVVQQPEFQAMLRRQQLFQTFVDLASSENQQPTPPLPVASFYGRQLDSATQDVMYRGADPEQRLKQAANQVRRQLKR